MLIVDDIAYVDMSKADSDSDDSDDDDDDGDYDSDAEWWMMICMMKSTLSPKCV